MWGQFLWRDDDSNDEVKMQNGWFDYCIFSDTLSLLVAEGNAWMICVYSIFTLKQSAWVQSLHSIRCCCCHLAEYADLDYAQFEPYCAGSSLDCEVNFGNHWQYCKLVNGPSNPFKILKQTILIYHPQTDLSKYFYRGKLNKTMGGQYVWILNNPNNMLNLLSTRLDVLLNAKMMSGGSHSVIAMPSQFLSFNIFLFSSSVHYYEFLMHNGGRK